MNSWSRSVLGFAGLDLSDDVMQGAVAEVFDREIERYSIAARHGADGEGRSPGMRLTVESAPVVASNPRVGRGGRTWWSRVQGISTARTMRQPPGSPGVFTRKQSSARCGMRRESR
jgi:hypothetical protein